MKKNCFTVEYQVYANLEDLEESDLRLLEKAEAARGHAYAPYSRFQVGAAVLLDNGELIGGSNYENASYPLCICAEQTVLTTAANLFPGVPVQAIAVTVRNPVRPVDRPGPPCGACRQVICETEYRYRKPIRVVLRGESGPVFVFSQGQDLLPLAFDQGFLLPPPASE
ncbi:MAG: hypothetical protein RLY31_2859 [Bacteroidota bacterium]